MDAFLGILAALFLVVWFACFPLSWQIQEGVFDGKPAKWWHDKCEKHMNHTKTLWIYVGFGVIFAFTIPGVVLYGVWELLAMIYRIANEV